MDDQGELAGMLLSLWREALDEPGLSLDDDVLMLGATSEQIMSVLGQVMERLGIEVSVEALFDAITIGDQVAILAAARC